MWRETGSLFHPVNVTLGVLSGFIVAYIVHKMHDMSADAMLKIVDHMSGQDFEKYVCNVLNNRGFTKAMTTKASHDHGADIIIPGLAIIQCKRYNKTTITDQAIHDVNRASKHYKGCKYKIIITNRKMSEENTLIAKKQKIIVIDRKRLKKFIKGDTNVIFRR